MTFDGLIELLEEDGLLLTEEKEYYKGDSSCNYIDLDLVDVLEFDMEKAKKVKILLNNSPIYPSMVRWNPATRELNLTQEVL